MCKLGVWAVALAMLLVSGCYVDRKGAAEAKIDFGEVLKPPEPIHGLVTLDGLSDAVGKELKIAISMELEENGYVKSVKMNQLDQAGNPDPCPDLLDIEDRVYKGTLDDECCGGFGYETWFKQDDMSFLMVVGSQQDLEIFRITQGDIWFNFQVDENPNNELGSFEAVEKNREIQKFQEKYFPENTSNSTSCDEDS